MYPSRMQYLGWLGDVLPRGQSLEIGQQYTFTFSFPWFSQYPSSADAISFLGGSLAGAANVVNASRGLFSQNFVVTIVPTVSLTVDEFIAAFSDAWKNAPWYVSSPTFVQAEGGSTSTQPGGVAQLLPEITGDISSTVGSTITATIKPLLPYLLLGIGGYLFLTIGLPKIMASTAAKKIAPRTVRRRQ